MKTYVETEYGVLCQTREVKEDLESAIAFSDSMAFKFGNGLRENLAYLFQWGNSNDPFVANRFHCVLFGDFAPFSFGFGIYTPDGGCVMSGGLIYHGPHDDGGSGSAPTFAVCLTPTYGWSIHT